MKPRIVNCKNEGLTLIEVLLVIAVLATVLSMFLPVYEASHQRQIALACQNNLKQITLGFQCWSSDHGGKFPMEISEADGGTKESVEKGNAVPSFQVLSNELKNPKFLICPADKTRVVATNFSSDFSSANISYFAGVDANTNNVWTLLSGDDNFTWQGVPVKPGLLELSTNGLSDWWRIPLGYAETRHAGMDESIAFADGRVEITYDFGLRNYLSQTGLATNRLAIP